MILEKGMAIWDTRYEMERLIITRTTATLAIAERTNGIGNKYEVKFYKEVPDNCSFSERGCHGYGSARYVVECKEVLERYKRKQLYKKYKEINYELLTNEQLEKIIEVAKC